MIFQTFLQNKNWQDKDPSVRLKVYRWLQSKKHVDSVEKHFHFSLEACAICQQFGKLIAGFLTF